MARASSSLADCMLRRALQLTKKLAMEEEFSQENSSDE
eukprot:CAMPEP_0204010400 /NCGR_PEP_ID=MMETSP0360-20130528/22518_1 /ASSEMBLY_ACC=CAM_ASM_000342 /TAXON_ID=268821 /ORGANISM="Scrippsiella Hangoei, Strain SHTV-5" /LENGTH=37 /DNA_ID= /DNA_START= /DNA_END= /DNA_ORIENTATION=